MTSTVPAEWGTVVTVIEVGELTMKLVATLEPIITAVTALKPDPLIVRGEPPRVEPVCIDNPVICGGLLATVTFRLRLAVAEFPAVSLTVYEQDSVPDQPTMGTKSKVSWLLELVAC